MGGGLSAVHSNTVSDWLVDRWETRVVGRPPPSKPIEAEGAAMKYWTMRNGTKIKLTDMSDSHLENVIKMVGRQIDSYPGDQVYTGDNYNSEMAVESENRINRNRLHDLMETHKALKREQVRRQPKLSPVIQPEEVARFRNYEER